VCYYRWRHASPQKRSIICAPRTQSDMRGQQERLQRIGTCVLDSAPARLQSPGQPVRRRPHFVRKADEVSSRQRRPGGREGRRIRSAARKLAAEIERDRVESQRARDRWVDLMVEHGPDYGGGYLLSVSGNWGCRLEGGDAEARKVLLGSIAAEKARRAEEARRKLERDERTRMLDLRADRQTRVTGQGRFDEVSGRFSVPAGNVAVESSRTEEYPTGRTRVRLGVPEQERWTSRSGTSRLHGGIEDAPPRGSGDPAPLPTTCSACGIKCRTPEALSRHWMRVHRITGS